MTYAKPVLREISIETAECSCYPDPTTPAEECAEAGYTWVGDVYTLEGFPPIPVGCLRPADLDQAPQAIVDEVAGGVVRWAEAVERSLMACVQQGPDSPECGIPEMT